MCVHHLKPIAFRMAKTHGVLAILSAVGLNNENNIRYFLYMQAGESLHEGGAKYPKKIVYAYTTPHYAVEALEVRIVPDKAVRSNGHS